MVASSDRFNHSETDMDVLVVEDEPTARRALFLLLSAHGYETTAVSSGEAALARVGSGNLPRVALIDLELPGMNGMELIRRLQVLSPTIYPVLVTAVDWDLVKRGRTFRGVGYLQKPVDFNRLLSMIDEEHDSSPT